MARSADEFKEALGEHLSALVDSLSKEEDFRRVLESGLDAIDQGALSWARLNQLMHLASEAGMSEGFYRYYFLEAPAQHPYPVTKVFSDGEYSPPHSIKSIASYRQLQWGIRRLMYDAMLYWGNIRQAYRDLRQRSFEEITALFSQKQTDDGQLVRRGQVVEPTDIPRDNRYLISEMACKTYDKQANLADCEHIDLALQAFRELKEQGQTATPDLLKNRTKIIAEKTGQLLLFELLFEESKKPVTTEEEVVALYT